MPHECDACGETFDTLSRLRLHDCPDDEPARSDERFEERRADIRKQRRETARRVKRNASDELTDAIDQAQQGEEMAVYQALAQYERQLSEEWAKGEDGEYWGFHRVFHGPVVESL
ncbi:MAG: putative nucleic acid-binding Zn-ribbon protein, partial [Haloarculaceae archaeon]